MDYAYQTGRAQAQALLSSALKSAGYDSQSALRVEPAKSAEFDLASPVAFMLAKDAKKAPAQVATTLLQAVKESADGSSGYIESVQAVNGYLNFNFSNRFFVDAAAQAAEAGDAYGQDDDNAGKTVIVEYSSPNVGKPMHIGHIRSTILGDAVANLFAASGAKVIRMNYLCEAGAQVAGLLLACEKWGMEKISNEKELLPYYVEISKKIEQDEALKKREQEIISLMESGDAAIASILMRVRELTIAPINQNYKRLGIRFDESVYDSDYVALSKKLVAEAVEKGLAQKDKNGEIVGLLEGKSSLPNLIILRSNGTTLYSTRDMGFAQWRWDKYHFDESVVVTASEQNTHFKQVFKLLELMGREYTPRLSHIGFGLVFLEGGVKLSTRKGNVLLLSDVLDEATSLAKAQIKHADEYSAEEVAAIADAVGVGAVKFAILRVSAEKNISFSIDKAVSFEGDTGAYLQYTLVRAKNILRKANSGQPVAPQGDAEMVAEEKTLAKMIAQYPNVVSASAASRAPHQICDYALKTAAAFSSFYAACPVLEAESDEKKQLRLLLVAATASVLGNALGLLGIVVPEKM